MEIDLLGRFAVRRDGGPVEDADFGGRRVRQLVRILAAERGRVVSRDALIHALWDDQPPADPAANLNVVVNRARRALGEPGLIQTTGGGYLLAGGPAVLVDAEAFEEHVERARTAHQRGDPAAAAAAAREALQLWDEPFPEDAYAEWARGSRDRLERLHQDALEIAATAALSTGRPREAVDLAAEAVARQPLREAAHLLLIRALAADGDQAAGVAAYLDLRRMLADELGIDPSPEASALYERLLQGTLSAPATGPRRGRRRACRRWSAAGTSSQRWPHWAGSTGSPSSRDARAGGSPGSSRTSGRSPTDPCSWRAPCCPSGTSRGASRGP